MYTIFVCNLCVCVCLCVFACVYVVCTLVPLILIGSHRRTEDIHLQDPEEVKRIRQGGVEISQGAIVQDRSQGFRHGAK